MDVCTCIDDCIPGSSVLSAEVLQDLTTLHRSENSLSAMKMVVFFALWSAENGPYEFSSGSTFE